MAPEEKRPVLSHLPAVSAEEHHRQARLESEPRRAPQSRKFPKPLSGNTCLRPFKSFPPQCWNRSVTAREDQHRFAPAPASHRWGRPGVPPHATHEAIDPVEVAPRKRGDGTAHLLTRPWLESPDRPEGAAKASGLKVRSHPRSNCEHRRAEHQE